MAELCFRNGDTLDRRLKRESTRVKRFISAYEDMGKAGEFTLALIRHSLDRASAAMISGDIDQGMEIYRVLIQFKDPHGK
jgi:hypothetical protein